MNILDIYMTHPFWWWIGVGVALLAAEVATGTSYLLWPSASAGVVAVLSLLHLTLPPGADAAIFAVLTIVSTLTARRYIHRQPDASDINDPHRRLVGQRGQAVAPFEQGRGRVFVDGKEWAAECESEAALAAGDKVEVAGIVDGGRLKVRPG